MPPAGLVERIRAHVPGALRELPVWLLHTPAKVPIYACGVPRHGELDSPADRAQLVTFEQAAAALPRVPHAPGLGIALGAVPGEDIIIAGIDLDHCIDAGGVIDPRVIELLGAAGSYAETSPSGRGVHILGTGDVGTTKAPGLEIYSSCRYFTATGNALNRAGLGDLSDAAALARRLYGVAEPARTPRLAPVVPISPEIVRRAGEQWAALLEVLRRMQMYRGRRGQWHDIICPWVHEHTGAEITGSAIAEPSARNGWMGGYRCHHAHCAHRGMRDIRLWCRELERLIDARRAR